MKKTDFNTKFMIDEGKTFAEWKEWVRKFKPTQAKAHVVQATLKNGKKFDRVYGSYVDAQNNAFALKQQLGAKNVKMFTSVNGGPLKLERSFDSSDEFDAEEKFFFEVLSRNGSVISRIKAPETISKAIAFRLADQESAKFKKPWAKCRIVDSKGKTFETYNRNFKTNEFVFKNMDASDDSSLVSRIAQKYALDAIGAGVVVPSFKAKTDVFKRLAQGNGPNDYNKAKKGLLDIVETIKKEIERQKSRNILQKQKDEILKRLNKELEEAKQSIELYKKGQQTGPMTTKAWNKPMLGHGVNWKAKDSVEEIGDAESVEEIREKYTKDVYSPILGKEFSGKGKDFDKALRDKRYEGLYKQIDFYLKHYAKQKKLSDVQMKDLKRLVNEIRSYGKNGERWVTEVKKTVKEFKDSCEDIENIREKYQSDAVGAGVVNPNFKFQTNVEKRLATTRRGSGRVMTLPQYGKPSKVIVKKDGNSFSVIGKDGQKLNKSPFRSYEEAEKWARGNGWMVERR